MKADKKAWREPFTESEGLSLMLADANVQSPLWVSKLWAVLQARFEDDRWAIIRWLSTFNPYLGGYPCTIIGQALGMKTTLPSKVTTAIGLPS